MMAFFFFFTFFYFFYFFYFSLHKILVIDRLELLVYYCDVFTNILNLFWWHSTGTSIGEQVM